MNQSLDTTINISRSRRAIATLVDLAVISLLLTLIVKVHDYASIAGLGEDVVQRMEQFRSGKVPIPAGQIPQHLWDWPSNPPPGVKTLIKLFLVIQCAVERKRLETST